MPRASLSVLGGPGIEKDSGRHGGAGFERNGGESLAKEKRIEING